ncbi:MAG: efflux RND transporter periplasmic adaptor subunit [Thiohalomonadales bacterium]
MKSIKTDTLNSDVKPGDDTDPGTDKSDVTNPNRPFNENATANKTISDKPFADKTVSDQDVPPRATNTEPARLCYVDDSRTSAYVVKRMLRPFGYSVDHYESAEPALIALVQGSYDLLLTDLKVSPKGMDGDDLLRALRNSGQSKISSLPVIVITGSTDTSVFADVYEAGANKIMTKPVNGDELNDHIRKLVYSHNSEQKDNDLGSTSHNSNDRLEARNPRKDPVSAHEDVVLESRPEGFSNFMGPTAFADKPANVVFFDSEIKQNRNADIDKSLQDFDSIPVLNSSDIDNPIPVLEAGIESESYVLSEGGSASSDTDSIAAELKDIDSKIFGNNSFGSNSFDNKSAEDADRRVLAQDSNAHGGLFSEPYVPRPTTRSAPAAKVRPTITTVKPTADENSDSIVKSSITNTDARREAARRAQAAVTAAQKNKRIMAEKAKKKAQAAAALKKLKEAAAMKVAIAKKAQQIQQIKKQKAIAAAKAKAIAAAKAAAAEKKRQQEAEAHKADNLKLRPKEESLTPAATAAPTAAPPTNASQGNAGQGLAAKKPIELVHPRDGGSPLNAGAQSPGFSRPAAPPPPPPPPPKEKVQAQAKQTPPIREKDQANDILSSMDQFPLVEADMPDTYAPSRFFAVFSSLFELYGFKKIMVMTLGILVVFFTYDTWSPILNINDGTAVDLSIVEQGEIFQAITVPGKVVSKLRVNITPSIAGRLTKVVADEGDSVKKGQLLARLDDREAKSYLKKATASYNSAKEDVVMAKRTLKRLSRAFKKGAIPRQLVEDAEVDLRSSRARKSISEEEVHSARVSLENPRILAPFSGVITNRFVEVGQWVVPSETLFSLIDPKQREVEVKVDSADSSGIAVGQTVSLSSDAFPGLEWSESVTRLAAATSSVGNANTISVYISLGTNAPSLRFGQQIDADIRTAWNPNAVKVPYGAIINEKGKSWVALLEGDKARLVEVTTGIEDFSHVEITQGVSIGETIILADGKRLRNGERVFLSTK